MFHFLKKKSKQKENISIGEIPDNVSALRFMMQKAGQYNLVRYSSLEEAKKAENSYLILEGDFGGQIFLTIPVRLIKTDEHAIKNLLIKLNNVTWGDVQQDGTGYYFEQIQPGQGIPGGMGGGLTYPDKIWVHTDLSGFEEMANDILTGAR